jgi:hypothetical protein
MAPSSTPWTFLKPTHTTLVPAAASLSMVTDPFSLGYTSSTESEALRAPRHYSMVEYCQVTLGHANFVVSSTYHFKPAFSWGWPFGRSAHGRALDGFQSLLRTVYYFTIESLLENPEFDPLEKVLDFFFHLKTIATDATRERDATKRLHIANQLRHESFELLI